MCPNLIVDVSGWKQDFLVEVVKYAKPESLVACAVDTSEYFVGWLLSSDLLSMQLGLSF